MKQLSIFKTCHELSCHHPLSKLSALITETPTAAPSGRAKRTLKTQHRGKTLSRHPSRDQNTLSLHLQSNRQTKLLTV